MEYAAKAAGAAAGVNPYFAASLPYIGAGARELWKYATGKKGQNYGTVPLLRRKWGPKRRRRVPAPKRRFRRRVYKRKRGRLGKRYGYKGRGTTLKQKISVSRALTAPYTITRTATMFREAQTNKKLIMAFDYDTGNMSGATDDKIMTLMAQTFRANIKGVITDFQKMAITDYKVLYEFRNFSKNRIHFTLYTCKVRHDYCRSAATNYAAVEAFDLNLMIASQLLQSNTTPVGTLNKVDPSVKFLDIPNVGQVIHVLKAKRYSLDAGDVMSINWKKKDHYYAQYPYSYNGTLVEDRFFVIEMHGDPLHGNQEAYSGTSLGDYRTIGYSAAKIGIKATWGATLWRVGQSASTKISFDTTTTPTNPGAVDVNDPTITPMDSVVTT